MMIVLFSMGMLINAVDSLSTICSILEMQIGLEGLGAPLELNVAPRFIALPGAITPGAVVSRSIILSNPTRAPAHFNISNLVTSAPTSSMGLSVTTVDLPSNCQSSSLTNHNAPPPAVAGPLTVTPALGVVLPLSETEVTVTFSATDDSVLGEHLHRLLCKVRT
jgi:hypothetical protein